MKRLIACSFVCLFAAAGVTSLSAATKYWDINGATAGAGGATPGGAWTGALWSTDPAGAIATGSFASGDEAVFSAGTDATGAFTVSANATAGSISIEEGTVTISGTITLGDGDISIGSGATLSTSSSLRISATAGSVMTINGGKAESTNPSTAGSFVDVDQTIVLNGGGTLSYTTAGLLNIVQTTTTISGTGPMIKDGAGILAIASASTYTGGTIISNGTLRVRGSSNRLPTATDMFVYAPGALDPGSTGGLIQQVNSINGDGNITYSASSTLIVAGNSNSTLSGLISDGTVFGRISKSGTGTLTLSGANTYDGSFTNNAGTTVVTSTGNLMGPDGDLVINGGAVNLDNAAQIILSLSGSGGTLNLSSGHALTINPAGTRTYLGAVTGAASVTKSGTGTTSLLGTNNYSGATSLNAGRLNTSTDSTGAGSFNVADSTTLGVKYTGGGKNLAMSDLTIGNSTLEFDLGGFALPSGKIVNDTGAVTVNGNVTVDAKGFNSAGGPLILLEHTGARGVGGAFVAGALPPHTAGEFLDDTANSRVLLTITNADTLVWVSDDVGVWDVNNSLNQIWKLTPANVAGDYQENTMQGDTVRFDDTATGTTTVNVSVAVSPYRVTVDNTTKTYAFSIPGNPGKISGPGSLTKSGTGELIVSTTNDYSGGTTLNAGTVSLGTDAVFGTGKLTINGGMLRSDSATAHSSSTAVDLNSDLTLGDPVNTGDLTFSTGVWTIQGASRTITVDTINATISGVIGQDAAGRGLTKNGNGTLSLTAVNTYSGGVVLNAGTLRINNNNSVPANSPVTLADGVTLSTTAGTGRTLTGIYTVNGNFSLGQASGGTAALTMAGSINLGGANRTITLVNAADTISATITNGGIIKEGTGTLTISSTTNTYAGGTRVNAGTLSINGTATLGSGDLTFNGGNMIQSANRAAGATLPNNISLLADATIRGDTTGTGTRAGRFGGVLSSSGGNLSIANNGTVAGILDLILSGGNYTFASNVVIGIGAETGGAQLSLFNTNTAPAVTYSGVISGYGSLRRSASTSGTGGTAILTGDNTYSGGTAVNDGILLVNNTTGSGTGSGAVSVTAGGTVGGTGTVAGAVSVASGGTISPGASAGTLTLQNGLDLSAGGTNVWELAANTTNNPGANYDQISLTGGNLVLGGTSRLRLSFTGTATFPDSTNAFWQQTNTWLIIAGSGSAANPGPTTFSSIDGVAGNTAGNFSTSADANGNVSLTFTPGVQAPPPVIDPYIAGAGTTSAQLSWSSVAGATYKVQYKTNISQLGWLDLTNLAATGTTTTIVDSTSPAPNERYYRVISP